MAGEHGVQLYYSPGSPYARVVRMAVLEAGLDIPLVETTLRDPASTLLPHNPVGRVPTLLLADGTALTEVLLILPFLDGLGSGPGLMPDSPSDRARLGRVMGLLDGIAVWNRELRRPVHERSPGVLALEETRAARTLQALEADLGSFGNVDAAWLVLAATLGYLDRRHRAWSWREAHPRLVVWLEDASRRPSFQATVPPASPA